MSAIFQGNFYVQVRKFMRPSGVKFVVFVVPMDLMKKFDLEIRGQGYGWQLGLPLESFGSVVEAREFIDSLRPVDILAAFQTIADSPF